MPDFSLSFTIYTDASDVGLGAVLTQQKGNYEHVIAYRERVFGYCWAVNYWRTYLLGKPFDVVTDHQCLTWLQGLNEPKGRLARWILSLQEYQFQIKHRPGKQNGNADAISRFPGNLDPTVSMTNDDDRLVTGVGATEIYAQWSIDELREAQDSYSGISRVVHHLSTTKEQPTASEDWITDGELRRCQKNVASTRNERCAVSPTRTGRPRRAGGLGYEVRFLVSHNDPCS